MLCWIARLSGRAPYDRIEAGLGELRERAVGDFEADLELRQPLLEVAQLDLRDVA